MRLDGVGNRVPGNESVEAHVKCVFEEVVGKLAGKDAVIDVIGLGAGANEVPIYLDGHWELWRGRVQAVVLGAPQTWAKEYRDLGFREFLGKVSFLSVLCEGFWGGEVVLVGVVD